MSEEINYKTLVDAYRLATENGNEPDVLFHDGSTTDGKCVGNAHVATGEGWCKCGEMREL